MLAKINQIGHSTVKVTKLDIDNYGAIIPLKELELRLPNDDSIIHTLKASPYAAIFTDNEEEDNSIIILAKGITEEELNNEKEKTIATMNRDQQV